jgi:hypothetical protein
LKPACERCGVFLDAPGSHCGPCGARVAEELEREHREMSRFPIARALLRVAFFAPVLAALLCIAVSLAVWLHSHL